MPDVVPERDELPHPKEDHELWQESVAVPWHDGNAGIGGYLRIGHEPNCEGGVAALGFGIVTREGARYRRNATSALTEADRLENGFGACDGRYRAQYDGGMTIRVVDNDCRLELELEDFYPRMDFFGAAAGDVRKVAPHHFETCLEASTNPRAGTAPIRTALRAALVDGLSRRDE